MAQIPHLVALTRYTSDGDGPYEYLIPNPTTAQITDLTTFFRYDDPEGEIEVHDVGLETFEQIRAEAGDAWAEWQRSREDVPASGYACRTCGATGQIANIYRHQTIWPVRVVERDGGLDTEDVDGFSLDSVDGEEIGFRCLACQSEAKNLVDLVVRTSDQEPR